MSVEFFEASLSRTANLSRSISEMNQRARETRAASPVRFGEAEAAKVARKMAKVREALSDICHCMATGLQDKESERDRAGSVFPRNPSQVQSCRVRRLGC